MASTSSSQQPSIPPRPPSTASQSSASTSSAKSPPVPDRSQSMSMPRTPNRREPPPLPLHPPGDREAREEMWSRELEEARTRLAQMEKTMRWWCDCTASWREKWSKVRNERNKARDECKRLRGKLDSFVKDCATLKKEKEEVLSHVDTLKLQLEALEETGTHKGSAETQNTVLNDIASGNTQLKGAINKTASADKLPDTNSEDFVCELLARQEKDRDSVSSKDSEKSDKKKSGRKSMENSPTDNPVLQQKVSALTMKLDEAHRTIHTEREEKLAIMKSVEQLQIELTSLKSQQEELRSSRSDVMKQLSQLKSQHRDEIGRVTADLEDEYISRSDMDAQLEKLRKELEKLQADNAQEWGKRERLESEKLALERDNKKLRAEVLNLEEDLMKKNQQTSAMLDGDLKTMQFDLTEKNKELVELKHSHLRVKKLLQEKCAELDHCKSRTDQYEVQVKKLRTRVDELKHSLATAEDEVDQQANQIRRLQRTNDELQVQCENLQVQVEHLQTRLRSSSNPMLTKRSSSHKKFALNDSLPTTDDDEPDLNAS